MQLTSREELGNLMALCTSPAHESQKLPPSSFPDYYPDLYVSFSAHFTYEVLLLRCPANAVGAAGSCPLNAPRLKTRIAASNLISTVSDGSTPPARPREDEGGFANTKKHPDP